MTVALGPDSYIYEGVWTNWNKGKVLGATLTVNPDHAAILSPALTLIISIAGSQLWRLFQFALHQSRATHGERNFLYHQQQVTLRNTATDLNTLWRLLRVAFAWRHQADVRTCLESLPLIIWTLAHLALVALASLFSSWLLYSGDEVLSRSPYCGITSKTYLDTVYSTDVNNTLAIAARFDYSNYKNSRYAAIQQHVDICDTSIEGCDILPSRKLSAESAIMADVCPFPASICHPGVATISFDTGFLSSAAHLGFNAPKGDRVSFRLTAECAPLDDVKHSTGWQTIAADSSSPSYEVSDACFGAGENMPRNATFSYSRQHMECAQRAIVPPYVLNSEWYPPGGSVAENTSTFDPIPELQMDYQDTNLIMLMADAQYDTPITDPWFSAQSAIDDTNAFCLNQNRTAYVREIPLTTIGCTQQWQICNTDSLAHINSTRCTAQQAISQLRKVFKSASELSVSYNSRQLATVDRILSAATASSFYYVIRALAQTNGAPLKARNLIGSSLGLSLPENQWQTETEYWMEILLAYLQQNSMDYSTGQFVSKTEYVNVTTPSSDATGSAYWLCQNQIIHSTSYRNFNFFALILCVTLCVIIIILGLSIEDIIGFMRQRRLRYTGHDGKQDMWIINSDLEMLRTISELKNHTRWTRSPLGIPLAGVGSKAGVEDLRSNDLEAEPGHGIYSKTVRRQQTMTSISLSPAKQRLYSCGVNEGHNGCSTCRSFELLPLSSKESLQRNRPDGTDRQNPRSHRLSSTNDIHAQAALSYDPLLSQDSITSTIRSDSPPSNSSQPRSSSPRKQGGNAEYSAVPSTRVTIGVVSKLPFTDDNSWNNIIPSDASEESAGNGRATLTFQNSINKRSGVVLHEINEDGSSGSASGTDNDTRAKHKKDRKWGWGRKAEEQHQGLIC